MRIKKAAMETATATATMFQCFDWMSLRAVERSKPNQEKPVVNRSVQSNNVCAFLCLCSSVVFVGEIRFQFHDIQYSSLCSYSKFG